MGKLGWFFFALLNLFIAPIWKGYVLTILWSWFVVTTFSAKPLGIAAAIGVLIIVSFLTAKSSILKDERTSQEKIMACFGAEFIYPLLVLGFAAIVKLWI